ncbi:MAG: hypothetical protein ABII76_17735 [Pseudomonadota bacterium]
MSGVSIFAASDGMSIARRRMSEIAECDVIAAIGPTDEVIVREALRTRASQHEFRRALMFLEGSANGDPKAYGALTNRVQRLVDLLSVARSGGIRAA